VLSRRNRATERIFPLVQGSLLWLCDVAAILARHITFFVSDRVIVLMKRPCLATCQRAVAHIGTLAPILIREPRINLGASRVILLPGVCLRGCPRYAQ